MSVRLHRSSTSLHAKMHHGARSCSPLRWWLQWCEQCKTQVTWRRPEQRPASCTTCPIRGRVCSPSSSLEESLLWFACSGADQGIYFTSYPAVFSCSFSSILTFCFFVTVGFKLDKVIWVYKEKLGLRSSSYLHLPVAFIDEPTWFSHQLSYGFRALLCHHHPSQPAAAPGRSKDGCASGWRPAENGPPTE